MDSIKSVLKICKSVLGFMLFIVVVLILFIYPCCILYAKMMEIIDNQILMLIFSLIFFICFCVVLTKGGKFVLSKCFMKDDKL